MVSPKAAPSFAIDSADLVAGLGRGLAVLESFDDEHWRMTIAAVAQRTEIPRSAVRRHLLSLCHFGYVETDGRQFWLGPRVLRLGQGYLDAARLPRLTRPFIHTLSIATGETVNVSVLDGHEVVYLARSNTPRVVSIGFHAGARAPAHTVSPGSVLVAALDARARAAWLDEHDFAAFTARTVATRAAFARQVRAAGEQGYYISQGQLDAGLTGVALALHDRRARCRAAISMTVQSQAWPVERIEAELLPGLRETAGLLRPIL